MEYTKKNLYARNSTLNVIIISYVISLVYKVFVVGTFGNDDIARVSIVSTVFFSLYGIINYILIIGVSKSIKEHNKNKSYKAIQNILHASIILSILFCLVIAILLYFDNGILEDRVLSIREEENILRVMIIPIIAMIFNSSIRGYFYGIGLEVAVNFSIMLEAVLSVIISVVYIFSYKSIHTSKSITGYSFMMGLFWAICASYLFLSFIYVVNREFIHNRIMKSTSNENESFLARFFVSKKEIFKSIDKKFLSTIIMFSIYKIATYSIYLLIGQKKLIQKERMLGINLKVEMIFNIGLFIALYYGVCILKDVDLEVVRKNFAKIRNMIDTALRYSLLILSPIAFIYLAILNKWTFIFQDDKEYTEFLQISIVYQVFTSLFILVLFLSSYVMIKAKLYSELLVNMFVTIILAISVEMIVLTITDGKFAYVIVTCFFSMILCVYNMWRMYNHLTYKIDIKNIGIPLASGAIAGLITALVVNLLYALTNINILSIIIGILMGIIIYFISIILFKGISKEEIVLMPKGKALLKVSKKIHIV